jgi:hypothetical protein
MHEELLKRGIKSIYLSMSHKMDHKERRQVCRNFVAIGVIVSIMSLWTSGTCRVYVLGQQRMSTAAKETATIQAVVNL